MGPKEREWLDAGIEDARKAGVRLIQIPRLVRRISPLNDVLAGVLLWKRLRSLRPHIVHTHTSKAGLLGRWAAIFAGVPRVVHTPHGHVFYGHFTQGPTRLFQVLERVTALVTDRIVALTEGEHDDYLRFSVCSPGKLEIIHSGVEIERFAEAPVNVEEGRKGLGVDPAAPVVGSVGWLTPVKAPMDLLLAMERVWPAHPEAVLLFLGQGAQERELKERVRRENNQDRVHFLGWRSDVPEILKLMDIFVLSSRNEGMGRAVVEAMAAGRPVVGTRVGGVPDLVRDDWNGFLVEPGDLDGMARSVSRLLENSGLRREMGRRGLELAWSYSLKHMVERIDALYASCFSTARGSKFKRTSTLSGLGPDSGSTSVPHFQWQPGKEAFGVGACVCCGSDRITKRPLGLEGFLECAVCGLMFKQSGNPDQSKIIQHYQEEDPHDQVASSKAAFFAEVLDDLSEFEHLQGNRLLDVGCGRGYFVGKALAGGWDAYGLDIIKRSTKTHVLGIPEHRLFSRTLMDADFEEGFFDVVTLWDVLFLLDAPYEEIEECYRVLKCGGVLGVRVRNARFQKLFFRLQRALRSLSERAGLKSLYVFHPFCFTPLALKALLRRAGFISVKVRNSPLTKGDPYQHGGSNEKVMALGKQGLDILSETAYIISGGRWMCGSSLLVWARKPVNRPGVNDL